MCVSLLVENDPTILAASVGLSQIGFVHDAGQSGTTRVEARAPSLVLRLGAGGRIVAETMTFNPYVVRRTNVTGDLWAHALLGESHGLLVVRGFSEWTSGHRLMRSGLANLFEVNCAFNRFAAPMGMAPAIDEPRDRLLLGNFTPVRRGPMLVPVLFDASRRPESTTQREFAVITRDPPMEVARTGAGHTPVSLTVEAALAWLHAASAEDPEATESQEQDAEMDFQEVLDDAREESYAFSLFKSA